MPKHTEVAPELPADSIDFNALHDACLKGVSSDDALAAAWPAHPKNAPEPSAEPASPAPASAPAKTAPDAA